MISIDTDVTLSLAELIIDYFLYLSNSTWTEYLTPANFYEVLHFKNYRFEVSF